MPNVVLLIPIADILDVTVDRIVTEKIDTQKNIDKKEIEELERGSSLIWLLDLFTKEKKLDISIFCYVFLYLLQKLLCYCIWEFVKDERGYIGLPGECF